MSRRCVVLLSGGLDSILAIRIMQEQGIEVEALNFKTVFTCCQDQSAQAAHKLGVRLTVLHQDDDYLELVKKPQFGYGKGANPCVDCRIYMFEKSKKFMHETGASFIVSGEVIGQRPKSQKRKDLDIISHRSGLEDLLLRPLSAKLLPPVLPEREGWVDREQLYGFWGRGRKPLIKLAHELGIDEIPTPSSGCALTEPRFSKKVFDLIQIGEGPKRWDYDLLTTGRHFRFSKQQKVIVGRNEADNDMLRYARRLPDAAESVLLEPANFRGAAALITGPVDDAVLAFAGGLVMRFSKTAEQPAPEVNLTTADGVSTMSVATHKLAAVADSITTAGV